MKRLEWTFFLSFMMIAIVIAAGAFGVAATALNGDMNEAANSARFIHNVLLVLGVVLWITTAIGLFRGLYHDVYKEKYRGAQA